MRVASERNAEIKHAFMQAGVHSMHIQAVRQKHILRQIRHTSAHNDIDRYRKIQLADGARR